MMHFFKLLKILWLLRRYNLLSKLIHKTQPKWVQMLYAVLIKLVCPWSRGAKENIADLLKELGPIYIKLGQTLSTRPDIVGEAAASDLRHLQDRLDPFPYEQIAASLESAYGKSMKEVFAEFDTSSSSASVAQVHKAKLLDGSWVAVKVLRPGIAQQYKSDMAFLYFINRWINFWFPSSRLAKTKEVLDLLNDAMKIELNLLLEAAYASEMRDNFENDDSIYVPAIYWELTTENVLVTEWIDGKTVYEAALDANHKSLANKLALSFFAQTYVHGLFHADLHPGNILITEDGKLVFLDFGIVGRLSDKDRVAVASILHAFLKRDYKRVALLHQKAGYLPQTTNLELFAQYCRAIAEPIAGKALKEVSLSNILLKLFKVMQQFSIEIQPQLILLQKGMVLLDGVGKILDPEINMWNTAAPWMENWAKEQLGYKALLLRLWGRLKDVLDKQLSDLA